MFSRPFLQCVTVNVNRDQEEKNKMCSGEEEKKSKIYQHQAWRCRYVVAVAVAVCCVSGRLSHGQRSRMSGPALMGVNLGSLGAAGC